jgi:peroxiredoxin Q/BCP
MGQQSLKDYLIETPIPFRIIGDPKFALYKKYAVEKSFWKILRSAFKKHPKEAMKKGNKLFQRKFKRDGSLIRLPADFILDEHGIITAVHYGTNIGDHLPITEILNN